MQFLGIIPARYASTRFPGKPLVDIAGKSMIRRVFEQASLSLDCVYVATDDERIEKHVHLFGGNVVMTSAEHRSGTDRCAEAAEKIYQKEGKSFNIVINIQGDEPLIQPAQLELLKNCFTDPKTLISTLIKKINSEEDLFNPNIPKVVIGQNQTVLYFSRSTIPYIINADPATWLQKHTFYKHIGLYAYRLEILQKIALLPMSSLELAESLEQNRWIEHGYHIKAAITETENLSVDTPEDLQKILEFLIKQSGD